MTHILLFISLSHFGLSQLDWFAFLTKYSDRFLYFNAPYHCNDLALELIPVQHQIQLSVAVIPVSHNLIKAQYLNGRSHLHKLTGIIGVTVRSSSID